MLHYYFLVEILILENQQKSETNVVITSVFMLSKVWPVI